jgi:hypothetical protein
MKQEPVRARPAKVCVEPIAMIGIGCRFPGAETPGQFWQLLAEEREVVRPIPSGRWDRAPLDGVAGSTGKIRSWCVGFLDSVRGFDWRAFGMLPATSGTWTRSTVCCWKWLGTGAGRPIWDWVKWGRPWGSRPWRRYSVRVFPRHLSFRSNDPVLWFSYTPLQVASGRPLFNSRSAPAPRSA